MRRPMMFAFTGFAGGIAISQIFSACLNVFVYLIFMTAGLFLMFLYRNVVKQPADNGLRVLLLHAGLFVLLFSTGASYYAVYSEIRFPYQDRVGDTITVTGCVTSVSIKSEDYYKIELDSSGLGKLMLSVSGAYEDIFSLYGCTAEFSGTVSEPDSAVNPKGFDYRLYLKTRDIRVIVKGKASTLKLISPPSGLRGRLLNITADIKYSFLEKLDGNMDETSKGLLMGMLFGDKNYMDEEIFEDFQKNGISHILAVSGIHVGIVYAFIDRLLRKPKSLASNTPIVCGLLFYAALAGFSASVVRAVFMICVYIGSKIWFYRYDILSCTSFCGIVILLKNPAMLFNTGFQLSFLAVFTLGLVLPRGIALGEQIKVRFGYTPPESLGKIKAKNVSDSHKNKETADFLRRENIKNTDEESVTGSTATRRKAVNAAADAIVPLIVIQIGMFPATAYLFYYFSVGAFFLNIPVIAISGIIIPLGIVLIVLSNIAPDTIFQFFCVMTELLIKMMKLMSDIVSQSGLGFKYIRSPSVGVFYMYYLILFFVCSEAGVKIIKECIKSGHIKRLSAGFIAAAVLCTCLSLYIDREYLKAEIIMLDVGQGDAVHVKAGSGNDVLFDSGGSNDYDVGKNTLLPYFLRNRVKDIDVAVISHLHQDHYGGLKSLAHLMPVKKLVVYEGNRIRQDEIVSDCGINADRILYVAAGDVINISKDVKIEILYPERKTDDEYRKFISDEGDENNLSLIAKIWYKDCSVLMTGDMTGDDEQKLSGDNRFSLDSDVLKVAHHGSRYSSTSRFLSEVTPGLAVIQVGNNFYGHPSPEIISRLEDYGAVVYRTDNDGAVLLDIGKKVIGVSRMLTPV